MKIIFSIYCSLIGLSVIAQDYEKTIDAGYGVLRIDAPLSELEKYLLPGTAEDMMQPVDEEMEEFYEKYGRIDLKKAGLATFFGMTVKQCDIYFDLGYDEKTEKEFINVYSFSFYFDKPSDEKKLDDMTSQMVNHYGDFMPMVHPENGEIIQLTWFSSLTLINASMGYDTETLEPMEYIVVSFHQAYGG